MALLRCIIRYFLNSVPSGIALLVLIGLYIAIGSGAAGVRERLEMDELLFFNWWPFKVLVGLLVINLMTVTVMRIPLTPPRYGVWCIHLGIVLLLISLGAYYKLKVEGMVPLVKGQTANWFYDRWERALYVRTPYSVNNVVLEGLPRFAPHDQQFGNASRLELPSLRNLEPQLSMLDAKTQQTQTTTLAEAIGAKQPVTLDIVGYYPYGMVEGWVIDPAVNNTGLKLTSGSGESTWIVGSEAAESVIPVTDHAVVEHRHVPTAADIEMSVAAAKRMHKLSIRVGDVTQDVSVEPGDVYQLGESGYSVRVEGFTPQFTLSSGDGKADLLTTMISRKNADGTVTEFRRQVMSGKDLQTDFELNVAGAGPFGKRKRDGVLDDRIHLVYTFSDPTKLLPTMDSLTAKYILFTAADTPGITMLRVSSREPSTVNKLADDAVDLKVTAPATMFDSHDHASEEPLALNVQRSDHVKRSDAVLVVPPERRDRDVAKAGAAQMVRVKVTCGDWSKIVPVLFDQFVMQSGFRGASIKVPGSEVPFQLMLGNQRRPLPVGVRLDGFEATPYAGGDVSLGSTMREFRSNITFMDQRGLAVRSSASLNNPAFYKRGGGGFFSPSESWIFSQASWNPNNLEWTALQVGNRPFVTNMLVACGLILGGLLYAFYLKPIVIKRMKANAIREAQARKKPQRVKKDELQELIHSA